MIQETPEKAMAQVINEQACMQRWLNVEASLARAQAVLGVIPEDERVQQSLVMKDALTHVYPKSKPSLEYKKIAAKLVNMEFNEKPGFFDKLFGRY